MSNHRPYRDRLGVGNEIGPIHMGVCDDGCNASETDTFRDWPPSDALASLRVK